ncbi:hypothetical protein WN51_14165 [Melipona quadrifasciata]|uniref:Uncharacterized protein n=1 Tax=Melipona quadrifasciata TaxID=166423 RepID=A0A0M8ZZ60_9HYME|nr:hypothetical protein WN51_14165 [Melipona quadrifasciata]
MNKQIFLSVVLLTILVNKGETLYCYRCNSNQPGCGTPLNWLWYWGETCPEYDDKCIKIIEKRGDIPADRYEGCRPAAKDVRLGHYVNNSIWQLDIHRDYYDEVTWCFCYFDHRCNGTDNVAISIILLFISIAIHQFTT